MQQNWDYQLHGHRHLVNLTDIPRSHKDFKILFLNYLLMITNHVEISTLWTKYTVQRHVLNFHIVSRCHPNDLSANSSHQLLTAVLYKPKQCHETRFQDNTRFKTIYNLITLIFTFFTYIHKVFARWSGFFNYLLPKRKLETLWFDFMT